MGVKKQNTSKQSRFNELLHQLKQRRARDRVRALEALTKLSHPAAVQQIIKALSDKSPLVRSSAAEQLGMIGKKEAIKPLLRRLADSNSYVRSIAARSLGDLLVDQKSSPPALIKRLKDADELVRIDTAESLGAIGDRRSLPALWKAIHDASPLVRSYIAEAIGELGDKKDVAKLEKELKKETSETAKVGFYHALYLLGQHNILQDLLMLLQSSDYRVRSAAANTLSTIHSNKSETPVILNALRKALRQEPTVAARSSIRSSLRAIKQ